MASIFDRTMGVVLVCSDRPRVSEGSVVVEAIAPVVPSGDLVPAKIQGVGRLEGIRPGVQVAQVKGSVECRIAGARGVVRSCIKKLRAWGRVISRNVCLLMQNSMGHIVAARREEASRKDAVMTFTSESRGDDRGWREL